MNRWEDYFSFSHGQGFLPKWCNTRMDVINEHFRGFGVQGFGGHQYAYDIETLIKVLHQAGVRITERSFDPSLDSELRKVGLYAEPDVKPWQKANSRPEGISLQACGDAGG
ncbi:MAG: hypothetical protein WAR24_10680 [Candidatus Acidiferrales bacterium]